MKKANHILWGVVLIALGLLFGLKTLGLIQFDIFFDGWWTLFIIVPCAVGLFTTQDKVGNLIGLLIGGLLLLACQDILSFDVLWKLAVPAIIIIVGLKLVFGGLFSGKSTAIVKKMQDSGKAPKQGFAAFGGRDMRFDGEPFDGAELTAVFGGVKCDLREAEIREDCVIQACAVFGGIDILLPPYVNVKVDATPIFGGVESKKHTNSKDNTVTVYVNGTAMFGGVEIR